MKASEIPDKWLKLVDKSQREALGLKTTDEHIAAGEIKLERDLHKAIANLLRLRGIEFFHSRTDKRTTRPVGEPDFIFAVMVKDFDKNALVIRSWPLAVAFELKTGGNALSEEQRAMFKRLNTHPNAWKCCVIRSVPEALAELKRLGL